MMNDDWYENFKQKLFDEVAHDTQLNREDIITVYAELSNLGLIDYDIEKEVLWDLYCTEEES